MAVPPEIERRVNDASELRQIREHLSRIDTSLEKRDIAIEKMADSVNKFALNVAQSEVLHKQSDVANKEMKTDIFALTGRIAVLETYQTRCEERSKPMSWLAGTVGTVLVTGLVTSAMALILIK